MKLMLLVFALCAVRGGPIKTVHLNNFGCYWRDWDVNTEIPHDAVHGGIGEDGHTTYIARSVHPKLGAMVPGKACPEEKKMLYEFDNHELEKTEDIQILCALNQKRLKWVDAKLGDRLTKVVKDNVLVIGGHDKAKPLAIGRQVIGNEFLIGRVIVDDKSGRFLEMRMSQDGKGWGAHKGYQVLVYVISESSLSGSINVEID